MREGVNCDERLGIFVTYLRREKYTCMSMVTMGGDLQPGGFADRLLTGLGQPQINP
jgi:hypothetical protein